MDMKLQKTLGAALALTLITGALCGVDTQIFAEAADAPVILDRENSALLLPDSYEEYLPLGSPAYVAMNGDHIAIADNYFIYIYDRAKGEYDVYHHLVGDTSEEISVSKVQFTDAGRLYFRDDASNLYEYDFDTGASVIVDNMPCLTFLIHGDYMYMANASPTSARVNFSYVPVTDMRQGAVQTLPGGKELAASNPRMAFENNTLYCIINNNTVNAYDGTTHEYLYGSKLDASCAQIPDLQFVCAYQNEFFYTVNGIGTAENGLYRTNHAGNAVRIAEGDKFYSITSYDGKLYCIQGSTIREMEVTADSVALTGYEISSASPSPHRLANAVEAARTKELVAYADAENRRISVYNRQDGTYTTIPCLDESETPFTPEHVAIDKEERRTEPNGDVITSNKIAVSSGKSVYVYTLERHSLYPEKNSAGDPAVHSVPQNVKGMSFVYGECYYITEYDGYGALGNDFTTELHFTGINTPEAITSDIYGTIYVAFGNRIFAFTEEEFQGDHAKGKELTSLSQSTDKVYIGLTVDYEGNVWHLTKDGKLYCNNVEAAQIDGKDFVYLGKEHDYPVSFALSFEDDEIYFNFKNYVVKTNPYALDRLVSLNKITADEAKTAAFALADPDNLFVRIPAGSVGFEIDLNELKTGTGKYFPYERYSRETGVTAGEARRGVLLYEPTDDDGYYVVALYEENSNSFSARLFKKSKNNLEPDENYFREANETRYITSDVSLCSAPCLYPAPANERLSTLSDTLLKRGDKLNVLGYAEGEDRAYAYVEVVSAERDAQRGFVPRSYLTANNPLGIPDDNYTLGYLVDGAVLKSADGEELTTTEDMQVKLYENGDGTYTAVVEKDGVVYTGTVTADNIMRGELNALRISLIVILSVLALVIVTGYVFLMFPRKKK